MHEVHASDPNVSGSPAWSDLRQFRLGPSRYRARQLEGGGMHRVNAGFTLLVPLKAECVDAVSSAARRARCDGTSESACRSRSRRRRTSRRSRSFPRRSTETSRFPRRSCSRRASAARRASRGELVRVMGDGLRELLQELRRLRRRLLGRRARRVPPRQPPWRHASTRACRTSAPRTCVATGSCGRRSRRTSTKRQESGGFRSRAAATPRRDPGAREGPSRPRVGHKSRSSRRSAHGWCSTGARWSSKRSSRRCSSARSRGSSSTARCSAWRSGAAGSRSARSCCLSAFSALHAPRSRAEADYVSSRPSDERARLLAATQNRPVINEFTLAGPIKEEGALRPLFLRLALWVDRRGWRRAFRASRTSVRASTSRRWRPRGGSPPIGGRRLIFISNYTNDGVAYVRDFIETHGGAMRINLSFGFGHGFPKTEWIIKEGALTEPNAYLYALDREPAADAVLVRPVSRHQHRQHQAQPERSARVCSADSRGRARKTGCISCERSEETLETDDIQGLVLRGYGVLHAARFLLLEVVNEQARARTSQGLCDAINRATRLARDSSAVQVAFTARGPRATRRAQECARHVLARVPRGHGRRRFAAETLGDRGDNDPSTWQWGRRRRARPHAPHGVRASTSDADGPARRRSRAAFEGGVPRAAREGDQQPLDESEGTLRLARRPVDAGDRRRARRAAEEEDTRSRGPVRSAGRVRPRLPQRLRRVHREPDGRSGRRSGEPSAGRFTTGRQEPRAATAPISSIAR